MLDKIWRFLKQLIQRLSELAAYALDEQPIYRNKGILDHPNSAISPQKLFEDCQIFKPWKNPK